MKKILTTLTLLFTLCSITIGQETYWKNVTSYQNDMTMVAEIYIDNEIIENNNIEIGAFCNEECRGS